MNDLTNFRLINEVEKKIIFTSLSNISPKILPLLYKLGGFLFVSTDKLYNEDNFPTIHLISNDQQKIVDLIDNKSRICSAGLYFGFIKKGNFYLSLEGAEYLFKYEIFSEFQQLQVNLKGEKSILYGNDIIRNMVVKAPTNLKEREFLLIVNKLNELIAISQSVIKSQNIQKLTHKRLIATNLSDKGYYLRKKQ